jgi:hypothetical protein
VIRQVNMDAEKKDDEKSETGSQLQQGSEQTPTSKLRDLRPEKDPMGAEIRTAQAPKAPR